MIGVFGGAGFVGRNLMDLYSSQSVMAKSFDRTVSQGHESRSVLVDYLVKETYTEVELPFDTAKAELLRLLKLSIKRRMVSDVPFGVLLSGGVDSSLNTALMTEILGKPVTSFSVGYEGAGDENEFEYARKIARRYNTNHHEVEINEKDVFDFIPDMIAHQDEPIADNVCIPLFFLTKLVKQSGTTVVQVGEGADEHFLGYWWCQDYLKKSLGQRNLNPLQWPKKISASSPCGLRSNVRAIFFGH